jgi:hypothetical protein
MLTRFNVLNVLAINIIDINNFKQLVFTVETDCFSYGTVWNLVFVLFARNSEFNTLSIVPTDAHYYKIIKC